MTALAEKDDSSTANANAEKRKIAKPDPNGSGAADTRNAAKKPDPNGSTACLSKVGSNIVHRNSTASSPKSSSSSIATATTANSSTDDMKESLPHKNSSSKAAKSEGNRFFADRKYSEAVSSYLEGLRLLKDDVELQISLRSNLAMAYLKLEDYTQAEKECTVVIEELDSNNAKVWYRRALAREQMVSGKASTTSGTSRDRGATLNNSLLIFSHAIDDLETSIKLLDKQKQHQEKKTVKLVLERIIKQRKRVEQQLLKIQDVSATKKNGRRGSSYQEQHLKQQQHQSRHHRQELDEEQDQGQDQEQEQDQTPPQLLKPKQEQSHQRKMSLPDVGQQPTQRIASPQTQRQDVVRLLMSRKMGLQSKNSAKSPLGEAFFLVNWTWWRSWCNYVDFFYRGEQEHEATPEKLRTRQNKVLQLLLQGSVLPKSSRKRSKSGQDREDDDDSTSTEESDDSLEDGPPGPIDNSSLFLSSLTEDLESTQRTFYRQWYQPHKMKSTKEGSTSSSSTPLRPNLVRGYNYELLPREVYSALRAWYGETTPSVWRRTTASEKTGDSRVEVKIYSQLSLDDNLKKLNAVCSACRARFALARCKRCLLSYYCDRTCQETHWPYHKARCKQAPPEAKEDSNSQTMDPGGRVGLNNLGNTCFMNSALQCLSHASPLTRLFLSGRFRADLNTTNPLGTGGMLANAYDSVIKELWMESKNSGGSTSPTALKRAIALFAPRFAGCLQHDAQEFLAYLLDGLHEDLNRVRKAPYVEMPDVTDGQNMAIAAAEAWAAHLRRNDSLVMDTFYGQFKSTCVCPKCERVSVSFDAFNHVSLEIPQLQKSAITISVMMFAAASSRKKNSKPVRYGISVRAGNLVSDIRMALSNLCGIPPARIILCEVYENLICEILPENKQVTNIRSSDIVAAYEIDPYTNGSIHVIASHMLLDNTSNVHSSEEEKMSNETSDSFGFPILTSFDANLTCRDVWDHLWKIVRRCVLPEDVLESENIDDDATVNDDCDSEADYKNFLQIRVVTNDGVPLPIFPSIASYDSANEAEIRRTSILPSNSDKKIINYLGKDSTSRFLFIALEWIDKPLVSVDVENEVEVKDNSGSASMIQESRFLAHDDHPSLHEAIRKQRAMNGIKGVTLDQCFDTFTKPERLDEHNMWYCSRCKEHVRALKTMELWRLPNILVVHLKRFEFRHGFRRDKLDTFVDFPLSELDMSDHCAYYNHCQAPSSSKTNRAAETDDNKIDFFVEDQVPAMYDLFAVVNHYGRMGFGHYTAFAREWDEGGMAGDWDLFDDSTVRGIGDGRGNDGVVSPAAYVLFYRRRIFS